MTVQDDLQAAVTALLAARDNLANAKATLAPLAADVADKQTALDASQTAMLTAQNVVARVQAEHDAAVGTLIGVAQNV